MGIFNRLYHHNDAIKSVHRYRSRCSLCRRPAFELTMTIRNCLALLGLASSNLRVVSRKRSPDSSARGNNHAAGAGNHKVASELLWPGIYNMTVLIKQLVHRTDEAD